MMRNKAKTSLIFVVGLLVGAFVTFIIFGKMNQRLYARSYALSVMEQAFLATELRAHRQDELQNAPESQSALRSVKDFYEMNGVPVPKEITSILNEPSSKH